MPVGPDKDKHGGGAESYARYKQYDYRAVSRSARLLAGTNSCTGCENLATFLLYSQCLLQPAHGKRVVPVPFATCGTSIAWRVFSFFHILVTQHGTQQ